MIVDVMSVTAPKFEYQARLNPITPFSTKMKRHCFSSISGAYCQTNRFDLFWEMINCLFILVINLSFIVDFVHFCVDDSTNSKTFGVSTMISKPAEREEHSSYSVYCKYDGIQCIAY